MQAAAQETLTDAVAEGPTDTGAIVTIDPATGGVRALVGGPDIATSSRSTPPCAPCASPGSTFKAFTLQAFIEAGYSPESRFPRRPSSRSRTRGYPIRNFGGSSFGEQTVYQATASSTNTVYVQMQEEVGREASSTRPPCRPARDKDDEVFPTDPSAARARRCAARRADPRVRTSSARWRWPAPSGPTPAEGLHVDAAPGHPGRGRRRAVVYEPPSTRSRRRLNVARAVTDVLRGVVTGGSGRRRDSDRPSPARPGPPTRPRRLVRRLRPAAGHLGLARQPRQLPDRGENATGGGLAAPVWATYMARAVEGLEVEDFTAPSLRPRGRRTRSREACPEGYEFATRRPRRTRTGSSPTSCRHHRRGGPPLRRDQAGGGAECPEGYAFAGPRRARRVRPRPDVLDEPSPTSRAAPASRSGAAEPEPDRRNPRNPNRAGARTRTRTGDRTRARARRRPEPEPGTRRPAGTRMTTGRPTVSRRGGTEEDGTPTRHLTVAARGAGSGDGAGGPQPVARPPRRSRAREHLVGVLPGPGGGRRSRPASVTTAVPEPAAGTPKASTKVPRARLWGWSGASVEVQHRARRTRRCRRTRRPLVAVRVANSAASRSFCSGHARGRAAATRPGRAEPRAQLGEELRLERADRQEPAVGAPVGVVVGRGPVEQVAARARSTRPRSRAARAGTRSATRHRRPSRTSMTCPSPDRARSSSAASTPMARKVPPPPKSAR
jgi:hypothetical protein